jgi:putative heme-binding domain-containing protein
LGGAATTDALATLSAAESPTHVRQQAIIGLAALNVSQAARAAAQLLRQSPNDGSDLDAVFAAFLRHKGGADALADALKNEKPSGDAAKIGLRVLVELGAPAPTLTAVLRSAAGQEGRKRTLDAAETKRLLALAQSQGDPSRGEAIFRRPSLGCFQCHALGGAGGRIGPDLSGIGTSAPMEYLLESIVLPSKVVREGYTTAHIVTTSGKALSGILHRESPKEIVLRDPIRDEIVIPVSEIEEKRVGGSLMPEGLDGLLTDAELADLVRFLSELGRPGSFVVTHVPRARRWQVLKSAPAQLLALDDVALGKALQEDALLAWTTAYSNVSGLLPLNEQTPGHAAIVVRTQLETLSPGRISLAWNNSAGLKLWVDGSVAPIHDKMTLELPRGVHNLTVVVDRKRRQELDLRCELVETPESPAQARFLLGK